MPGGRVYPLPPLPLSELKMEFPGLCVASLTVPDPCEEGRNPFAYWHFSHLNLYMGRTLIVVTLEFSHEDRELLKRDFYK